MKHLLTRSILACLILIGSWGVANKVSATEPELLLGSITVCNIVAGENNTPGDGAQKSGVTFSIMGIDFDGNGIVEPATGIIPTSTFSTPLSLNTDLMGNDSVYDAQCITYSNLALGSYFYDTEQISTTTAWNTPRYNDQHTIAVEDVYDFFPYSGELFTENESDDAARDTNADGHISLTECRPHRTLVVLNTFETENEDNENARPIITVVGANPLQLTVGGTFTDPGATAFDEEDGDITGSIVISGNTVNTAVAGAYIVQYNVSDSDGAAADEKTRIVQVEEQRGRTPNPACSDEADNDLDLLADEEDPGCHTDGNKNNADSYDPNDADETNEENESGRPASESRPVISGGGGGGGGSRITLEITNEAVSLNTDGSAVVTWDTNLQAASQVLYDTAPHGSTTTIPSHAAYAYRTATSTVFVNSHRMTIAGINANTTYYFRPVSSRADEDAMGKELKIIPALISTTTAITREPCREYLLQYIKLGQPNDELEVRKLETFLNVFEGFSLPVDGVYDQQDYDAVGAFQERYFDDILKPWGHTKRTGYVYYTTRKKINEIVCNQLFPLNAAQTAEVEEFRALLEQLRQQGIVPETVVDTGSIGKAEEEKGTLIAKEDKQTEPTSTEESLLTDILAQPTAPRDAMGENKGLAARILDAIDEKSRSIGIALIFLALLIATIGIWRSRKNQEEPPYPPIV